MEHWAALITPENFAYITAIFLLFRTTGAIEGLSRSMKDTCNILTKLLTTLNDTSNEINNKVTRLDVYLDVMQRFKQRDSRADEKAVK